MLHQNSQYKKTQGQGIKMLKMLDLSLYIIYWENVDIKL